MWRLTVTTCALALALTAAPALGGGAGTALEAALDDGAKRLTADEIARTLVGKTVRAVSGGKTFLCHYGADNVVSCKLDGGSWSDTGYYGITDDDRVCLSLSKSDQGRLRCLTLLARDGTIRKYRPDGSMSFELLEFREGKTF